jgi:hypothetical protein
MNRKKKACSRRMTDKPWSLSSALSVRFATNHALAANKNAVKTFKPG